MYQGWMFISAKYFLACNFGSCPDIEDKPETKDVKTKAPNLWQIHLLGSFSCAECYKINVG